MYKGRIRSFWPDKGFGFIFCKSLGTTDVFVHGDSFVDGQLPEPLGGSASDPAKGEEVEFYYEKGKNNKARAKNVKIVGPAIQSASAGSWQSGPSGFELELERVLVEVLRKGQGCVKLNDSGYAVMADLLEQPGVRRASQQIVAAGRADSPA